MPRSFVFFLYNLLERNSDLESEITNIKEKLDVTNSKIQLIDNINSSVTMFAEKMHYYQIELLI